ncbi:MAG: histidine phosphatase family protein [Subtercola sp.]|nr:histidine phosphatase family protein [Subtercola sp.]
MTEIWLVRHGESVANVAAAEAERAGRDRIDLTHRDADVPLSETGVRQAEALGDWLNRNRHETESMSVWASSYLRAQQTIMIGLERASLHHEPRIDERLRDRELGILDMVTSVGVDNLFPAEADRRRWLGKFYYRPPGGESWADVALRVRSLLHDIEQEANAHPVAAHGGGSVLIATHDAVVMVFIYVCTGMTEADLLDFSCTHTVSNASVTRLVRPPGAGQWRLDVFSHVGHLDAQGVPSTQHSGDKDAAIH